jgi:hypothetical protein
VYLLGRCGNHRKRATKRQRIQQSFKVRVWNAVFNNYLRAPECKSTCRVATSERSVRYLNLLPINDYQNDPFRQPAASRRPPLVLDRHSVFKLVLSVYEGPLGVNIMGRIVIPNPLSSTPSPDHKSGIDQLPRAYVIFQY